jgi:hypothetical protein
VTPIGSTDTALTGLRRQLDRIEGAAGAVAQLSSQGSARDAVAISPAARTADSSAAASGGLEGAMVDLRISKYLAVANLQVLKTQDELAETALSILR